MYTVTSRRVEIAKDRPNKLINRKNFHIKKINYFNKFSKKLILNKIYLLNFGLYNNVKVVFDIFDISKRIFLLNQ